MKTPRILMIVLASALVLNGCSNIFSDKPAPGEPSPETHVPLPAGYGAVKISLVHGAARTAMPVSAFDHFEYLFAKDGGGPKAVSPEDGLFVLEQGNYQLTVKAFVGAGEDSLAATGNSGPFVITAGQEAPDVIVTMRPVVTGSGTGTLQFGLTYPSEVMVEAFTLSRLAGDTTYDLKRYGETTATNPVTLSGTLDNIPVGYYLLEVFLLNEKGIGTGKTEVVHIYQNMVTQTNQADYTFTDDDFKVYVVTNTNDSGPGSLRKAITDAATGSLILLKLTPEQGAVIALRSRLEISKNLFIRGNGVTITRDPSWTTEDGASQLLYVNGSYTVSISRIHFKDGRATDYGAAIRNGGGTLTLESCIFSGNRTSSTGTNAWGGAVYSNGTMRLRGCTFNNNVTSGYGGAVYNSGTLTLAGNLFYGNTASNSGAVVYTSGGTVTSNGYNVSDTTLVTPSSGTWTGDSTDATISALPVSFVSFRLLSGSGAANVIDTRPTVSPGVYPTVDFYGNAIPETNAASGAVQDVASGSGPTLNMEVNYNSRGSISASPPLNADGFVSTVTLEATPLSGYDLAYWLVNGRDNGYENPLTLNITANTKVQAVFVPMREVTNANDTGAGSLRQVINNIPAEGVINVNLPQGGVIALTSRLEINKNLFIRGNGVTITRDPSWTTEDGNSQLLSVGGTVTISRIHFKDGRATDYGAAIRNNGGTLTLESCIFSGNRTGTGPNAYGGVYNGGTMRLRGCTFYNNVTSGYGGAVYNSGTLTLAGNLFYGNTASNGGPAVYRSSTGTVTSNGYNVSDTSLVTPGSGTWTGDSTDVTISALPVSPKSFRLLSGSEAAGVIITKPVVNPSVYPTVDFYGNPIPETNAASGAVQDVASGSGPTLNMEVNYNSRGSISASPPLNADGFISTVTLEATPLSGYDLAYWLVNGSDAGYENPLTLNITAHTKIEAVFVPMREVTNTDDSGAGSLRQAINDIPVGGVINVNLPQGSVIALTSRLSIGKNLFIHGNGITITRDQSWTTEDNATQLLSVGGTVTISRIHFKDGRATDFGAAINNGGGGILTLESCIFSGNRTGTAINATGGAVYNLGTMRLRGCTFYNNVTSGYGGAVSNSGTLTLAGNLFYGNTANNGPAVYWSSGTVTSNGYNVVDVLLGTGTTQSGWTTATGDTTFSTLSIVGTPFNTTTFEPVSGIRNLVPNPPIIGFPTVDFYGNPRTFPGAPGAVK